MKFLHRKFQISYMNSQEYSKLKPFWLNNNQTKLK
ncbi:hypothetical protein F964_01543 [Acinetobacter guillouiae NIPH 991]|uniref:Uncharacterized protein n=1 Tax=Acinetobacter guillouiae NIPH 991 TaxID=1217656 RepID=N8YAA9_ACIGI|nr:hypothetical protein F964_01543 [Acinetobacter guillouiae NIPH 991]